MQLSYDHPLRQTAKQDELPLTFWRLLRIFWCSFWRFLAISSVLAVASSLTISFAFPWLLGRPESYALADILAPPAALIPVLHSLDGA